MIDFFNNVIGYTKKLNICTYKQFIFHFWSIPLFQPNFQVPQVVPLPELLWSVVLKILLLYIYIMPEHSAEHNVFSQWYIIFLQQKHCNLQVINGISFGLQIQKLLTSTECSNFHSIFILSTKGPQWLASSEGYD